MTLMKKGYQRKEGLSTDLCCISNTQRFLELNALLYLSLLKQQSFERFYDSHKEGLSTDLCCISHSTEIIF